jgi:hypothetical protein
MPDRSALNAGKRSSRDKADLTAALQSGDTLETAARYLLRPIDETAKMAVELGLLVRLGDRYSIDLYKDDADGGSIETPLATENNLEAARWLHGVLCAQYPGHQVLLRHRVQVIARND